MKKTVCLVLAVVLVLALAGGCGGRAASEAEIRSVLKENLNILAQRNPDSDSFEAETLEDSAFEEIVGLGDGALPFLQMITQRREAEAEVWLGVLPGHAAGYAAVLAEYAIDPSIYDLSFPSPDGRYTAAVMVDSFISFYNHGASYNDIFIADNASGEYVCRTEAKQTFFTGGLFDVKVNWSADSRFAVISCPGRRSGSTMAVDVQEKMFFCLPEAQDAVDYVYPGSDAKTLIQPARYWFDFEKWESEHVAVITFLVSVIDDGRGDFSGRYTYNIMTKEILDFEYDFLD